jgi:kumamolisin
VDEERYGKEHDMAKMTSRTAIAGSSRAPLPGATVIAPVDPDERIEATIVLRRAAPLPAPQAGVVLSREAFIAQHAARPSDADAIAAFAHDHGLTVTAVHLDRRSMRVAGPAAAMQEAFGTELSQFDSPRGRYCGRVGALTLPASIAPLVDAVLGLDNRPMAKPHLRILAAPAAARALRPTEVARAYTFPTKVDGAGQTIAIIELGGGFSSSDLDTYFKSIGVKRPLVSAVGVLTGVNQPGVDQNSDGEVMLDIEVSGAVAPGAKIVVYFAPNTDQGFHDAIAQAVHDTVNKPSVISISWGAPESEWTAQAMKVMDAAMQDAAALQITVTAATGDNGSTDGAADGKDHADFPCSSPFALACGGTRLELSAKGAIQREVAWNNLPDGGATGGGFSTVFTQPAYQAGSNAAKLGKMRGVPDVAGDADPNTGYDVLVDGATMVIGGTSAVAPLWAGLIALVNEQNGKPVGFWNPALYAGAPRSGFHDIVSGNNGTFAAGPGWDAATGLGSPNGQQLVVLAGGGSVKT